MENSVENTIRGLKSADLDDQLRALDCAKLQVDQLLHEAVHSLFQSVDRYVIAEKLLRLGTKIIPELEARLLAEGDHEAMAYASLLLLKLGSFRGIPQLMRAIREGVGPVGMIAESLGAASIPGAGEAISDALMKWPIRNDPYTAVTMIKVLKQLSFPIPVLSLNILKAAAPNLYRLL